MSYENDRNFIVWNAAVTLLRVQKKCYITGTWDEVRKALLDVVPHGSKWAFPDSNKGLAYTLKQIENNLNAQYIYIAKHKLSQKRAVTLEVKEPFYLKNRLVQKENKMININNGTIERVLKSGGVIPAATAARVTEISKIHIGMRTSTGRLVSMCNNTRLNKPNALTNLRLDLYPQITCKQCIAGMMNAGANSYELIMSALNGFCREGEMLSMPAMEHMPVPNKQAVPNMNVPKPRVDEKVNPMKDRVIHLIKAAEELDLTNVEELLKVGTPEALELMAYLIKEGYAKLKEDCVITLI